MDDETLTGVVAATENWDHYHEVTLGEVQIPAGAQTLSFRSAGPLQGNRFLLDLRTIRLEPLP